MAFSDELSGFIDPDMPGYVEVSIEYGDTVGGILDNEYSDLNGMIGGNTPILTCKTSDVSEADNGDIVIIDSATEYTISGTPEPDGTGLTIIRLRES